MSISLSLDVNLPPRFTLDRIDNYVSEMLLFLSSPLVRSLILAHPNEIAIQGEWSLDWWTWAGGIEANQRQAVIEGLIKSATNKHMSSEIALHPSLASLINDITTLRLPREIDSSLDTPSPLLVGMSPKKAHEVDKLCALIGRAFPHTRLIVDVGAGQGYLSRRLAESSPHTRVLALDGDEGQTEGAALRGKGLSHAQRQQARKDSETIALAERVEQAVTHRTLFITSDSLSFAVNEWISGLGVGQRDVLVTGLHACGSLTPAVLKCFVDLAQAKGGTWRPSALALVGCCYNLMRDPNDFPLSRLTSTNPTKLILTQNHLQLAAQCPAQWSSTPVERERAMLARRKIVWRALLARLLSTSSVQSTTRLGRLPDRAYASWDTFLGVACAKMGVDVSQAGEADVETVDKLAFRLEMLHILRALIGPVIESLIVVDRAVYLAEQVGSHSIVRVVNVFDQIKNGSPRNIALVVEPRN